MTTLQSQRLRTPAPARYAKMPEAPINASPVPRLTSLYHFDDLGPYGDRRYPGNCGGLLIRDLLIYFRATSVLDPRRGSGTCGDVCAELGIPCRSFDIKTGFDAADSSAWAAVAEERPFDFVWAHPPYWRQKVYSTDPRDLSAAPTLDAFLVGYERFIAAAAGTLPAGGKLAILMGDYTDRFEGFIPLVYHTKRLAFTAGLRQGCTDIIRFGHGSSSSKKGVPLRVHPGPARCVHGLQQGCSSHGRMTVSPATVPEDCIETGNQPPSRSRGGLGRVEGAQAAFANGGHGAGKSSSSLRVASPRNSGLRLA